MPGWPGNRIKAVKTLLILAGEENGHGEKRIETEEMPLLRHRLLQVWLRAALPVRLRDDVWVRQVLLLLHLRKVRGSQGEWEMKALTVGEVRSYLTCDGDLPIKIQVGSILFDIIRVDLLEGGGACLVAGVKPDDKKREE